MITPTKGISTERALLSVAAQIALVLREPMTVSETWHAFQSSRSPRSRQEAISYSWFILALDVLFALGAVDLRNGLLQRIEAT